MKEIKYTVSKKYLEIEDLKAMNPDDVIWVNRSVIMYTMADLQRNDCESEKLRILNKALIEHNKLDSEEYNTQITWGIDMRVEDALFVFGNAVDLRGTAFIEKEKNQDIESLEQQLADTKANRLFEIKMELKDLKKESEFYNNRLKAICASQSALKKEYCVIDGHSWTPWLEKPGVLDRTWNYSRTCIECGETQSDSQYYLSKCLDREVDVYYEDSWNRMSAKEQQAKVLELKIKKTSV